MTTTRSLELSGELKGEHHRLGFIGQKCKAERERQEAFTAAGMRWEQKQLKLGRGTCDGAKLWEG